MSRSVFIRCVPYNARNEDLYDAFAKYGHVKDVYIPRDYYTRKPRGFAYIEFESLRDAQKLVIECPQVRLFGRDLEFEFAQGDRKTPHEMRHLYSDKDFPDRRQDRRQESPRRFSPRRGSPRRFSPRRGSPRNRSRRSSSRRSREESRERSRFRPRSRSRSRSRSLIKMIDFRQRRRSYSPEIPNNRKHRNSFDRNGSDNYRKANFSFDKF